MAGGLRRIWPALILALCLQTALAAQGPPTTVGWQMTPVYQDGFARIQIAIDNLEELWAYDGKVGRIWGDIGPNPDPAKSIPIPGVPGGAWILGLELIVDADPVVTLNFNVQAGAMPTNFSIVSPLLSFPQINSAFGTMTAAITATDTDGNGATASGLFSNRFYEGRYNSLSWTSFGNLVYGPVVAPPYGSTTASETKPPWVAMGSVYDMQSEFRFSVTAYDSVSGTSNFVVIPEPAGVMSLLAGALGLGGLVRLRRRA